MGGEVLWCHNVALVIFKLHCVQHCQILTSFEELLHQNRKMFYQGPQNYRLMAISYEHTGKLFIRKEFR